jgi:site-specific DNA-methyltransferase (adenine-specific)
MTATAWHPDGDDLVIAGDNLPALAGFPDASFQLIYIDPPFNTGRVQSRQTMTTVRTPGGTRKGFQGREYDTVKGLLYKYDDAFADYWEFLEPRLEEAWRLLTDSGTLYLHLDWREVHYAKVVLDALFGRECFLNEIIWAYDYGARAKNKWPAKHDTILVYVKNPRGYYFDNAEVDREPYMAPGLVTPEKVALGKLPTGYATQKPEGILRRIIHASSAPGDWVLDFFAGSGTTGAVAHKLGRRFVLVEQNPDALAIIAKRLPHTALDTLAP